MKRAYLSRTRPNNLGQKTEPQNHSKTLVKWRFWAGPIKNGGPTRTRWSGNHQKPLVEPAKCSGETPFGMTVAAVPPAENTKICKENLLKPMENMMYSLAQHAWPRVRQCPGYARTRWNRKPYKTNRKSTFPIQKPSVPIRNELFQTIELLHDMIRRATPQLNNRGINCEQTCYHEVKPANSWKAGNLPRACAAILALGPPPPPHNPIQNAWPK